MRLPENIVRRGGVYQFRIDVPIDCQGRLPFGKAKEWKRSLKTNDLREAVERAARMRIQFQKLCREAKAENDPRVIAAKRTGGWIEPSSGKMLDFHSFRHTFKTRARQQMPEEWSDAITGHSNGKLIGRSYGKYELQTMKEQIDKIEWPI